ncbi:HET-domain-containing protein [Cadophora sp. DSE1049]|nr:HET-domain-containing protein [Cadophora sp. DSE1049]
MADTVSRLELCGQCWWRTTDPYTLATSLLSKDSPGPFGSDNVADELRQAQRGARKVWFLKNSEECHFGGHQSVVSQPPNSFAMHLDRTETSLLRALDEHRGYLRFVVSSDSVVIDQEYLSNRLSSSTGMTKWDGPQQIIKPCRRSSDQFNIFRNMDDIIQFTMYLSPENLAMPIISQRRVANIASPIAMEASRACLETCLTTHAHCRMSDLPLLPTRVLDLQEFRNDSGPCIRLHVSQNGETGHYAALSYCWGGPQAITTTMSTLHSHLEALTLRDCSQSIKDAVIVARGLQIQFLWIDALCIIQDGTSDKLHEIERMGSIYKNATVTIAAANSSSAACGFLQPHLPEQLNELPNSASAQTSKAGSSDGDSQARSSFCNIWYNREPEHNHSTEPLSRRGWAFQEQVLSERLLQYGSKGLTWHCLETDRTVPILHSFVQYKPRSKASHPAILRRSVNVKGQIGYQLWNEMIEDYSHRSLTDQRDRLLAIAGIAAELHDLSGDAYLAGLWDKYLIKQLGWRQAKDDPATKVPVSVARIAPTWSWACVNGAVQFGGRYKGLYKGLYPYPSVAVTADAKVRHCSIHIKHASSPFGDVELGELTISAKVMEGPHPLALHHSSIGQVRQELGIIHENALIGTSNSTSPDTLEVTLDQSSKTGAMQFGVDSRRVVNGNVFGLPTVWYLLLGYCYNQSPIGLILASCGESRYRRIGYFQSRHPDQPPLRFNKFLSTIEKMDFTII